MRTVSMGLAGLALAALMPLARGTTTPVDAPGWYRFDVDTTLPTGAHWADLNDYSALSFSLVVAAGTRATLTVVDAGFAGDTFQVFDGARLLGTTSAPGASYPASIDDFDAALADARFSRGRYTLAAGSHTISGLLAQSVLLDGEPLGATTGAIRVEISPVPEPSTLSLMLAGGLVAVVLAARRRND